ncbi:MAG: dihydrodipicolinate synthase family protein [Fimbriimonadaceae bacterium]|nr:dihydrodipicolinate synthase family protein [Fimbriimonadaceae bacterium]
MTSIAGVVPILPTPFDQSAAVDLGAMRALLDFAVAGGVPQVCLPAYGSEFYKLTDREKLDLIAAAVAAADGRVKVLGQCNHGSPQVAAELARQAAAAGADLISVALPRLFPIGEENLLRWAAVVCRAVEIPVLLQDFNPGGATVGPEFCVRLQQQCGNFRYVKLEEPRMAAKMEAIHEATGRAVGVLEGWGGVYLPELIPRGLVGVMPGFVLSDLLVRVWDEFSTGDPVAGFALFGEILPLINFSLENFEVYHHVEKRLLVQRGVLPRAVVRDFTCPPDASAEAYLAFLADRLWETLERWGRPRRPLD